MKRLIAIVLAIVAVLAFSQPVLAKTPIYNAPPETYPISGTVLDFPEVSMSINISGITGTYTPHIVHPAGKTNIGGSYITEESWIEFTGQGSGIITIHGIPLVFTVPSETTIKVTVHIQPNSAPIITFISSAPVSILDLGAFTNTQIRILTESPYFQIVHMN